MSLKDKACALVCKSGVSICAYVPTPNRTFFDTDRGVVLLGRAQARVVLGGQYVESGRGVGRGFETREC
eukprot:2829032-Lingulodinium_polyedra.AAC.1